MTDARATTSPRPHGAPGAPGPPGGPLHGVRVLELAAVGPAPYACMMLADLGAEVVRVERPDGGRPFAAWHNVLDRGRRRVRLDLKRDGAAEALLRLVERSDVLIEGFRPGVTERLGIGPEPCLARNPALVYGRMTGWGQQGPLSGTPGHDINYLALSGALDTIGPAGRPPVPPLNLLGDFGGGGMLLLAGVLAALVERQASGRGQVVDAAVVDGTASLLGMVTAMTDAGQWQPDRGTNLLDGGAPFYTVYRCADGGHVAVGALEDRFYAALLDGLGLPAGDLPDRADRDNWPRLREVFAGRFAAAGRAHWQEVFAATEACVTPVLPLAEAARHPHLRSRGTFLPGPGAPSPAPAPRFTRTPAPGPAAALPDDDTARLLGACGLDAASVRRLSDPRPRPGGTAP